MPFTKSSSPPGGSPAAPPPLPTPPPQGNERKCSAPRRPSLPTALAPPPPPWSRSSGGRAPKQRPLHSRPPPPHTLPSGAPAMPPPPPPPLCPRLPRPRSVPPSPAAPEGGPAHPRRPPRTGLGVRPGWPSALAAPTAGFRPPCFAPADGRGRVEGRKELEQDKGRVPRPFVRMSAPPPPSPKQPALSAHPRSESSPAPQGRPPRRPEGKASMCNPPPATPPSSQPDMGPGAPAAVRHGHTARTAAPSPSHPAQATPAEAAATQSALATTTPTPPPKRTSMYLAMHRSTHTCSPVLSSASWKRGTHFLKHPSVILRGPGGGAGRTGKMGKAGAPTKREAAAGGPRRARRGDTPPGWYGEERASAAVTPHKMPVSTLCHRPGRKRPARPATPCPSPTDPLTGAERGHMRARPPPSLTRQGPPGAAGAAPGWGLPTPPPPRRWAPPCEEQGGMAQGPRCKHQRRRGWGR